MLRVLINGEAERLLFLSFDFNTPTVNNDVNCTVCSVYCNILTHECNVKPT